MVGIALGNPVYADSSGPAQSRGITIDVSQTPDSTVYRGWYSENSVQNFFWRVHQEEDIGLTPIHDVMTGPLKTSSLLASIHNFAALLKARTPDATSRINAHLAALIITSNDALGTGETNDGGVPPALPVYKTYPSATPFCTSDLANHIGNGLGMYVNIRFNIASAGVHTITVAAQSPTTGTDPDIYLIRPNGTTDISDATTANREVYTGTLATGDHTLVLNDYRQTSSSVVGTGSRCFTLLIQ